MPIRLVGNNTAISTFDEMVYFTGLTNINGAFSNSSITKVTLPAGIRITDSSSWKNLFYGCSSLEEIDFSDCERTGNGMNTTTQWFVNCSSLTKLHFESISQMLNFAKAEYTSSDVPFANNNDEHYVYVNGQELRSLVIPSTITEIPDAAFYRYNRLTSVTIPSGVTSIGDFSFSGCSSLSGIEIPSSVIYIGQWAFGRCSNLSGSIVIPSSVTTIGIWGFSYCESIQNFTVNTDINLNTIAYSGNGTGTLIINGNVLRDSTSDFSINFKKVFINGNIRRNTGVSLFINSSKTIEQIRISGNVDFNSVLLYGGSGERNCALRFFELMGTSTCSFFSNVANGQYTLSPSGTIIHLGYDTVTNDALPCTPVQACASFPDLLKIYVGKGQSASEDNAILAKYLDDTDWLVYESKLDTWYNYVNSPDANPDYIN